MPDYRGLIIGRSVSANNVRRAAQIGRSADQINCCELILVLLTPSPYF